MTQIIASQKTEFAIDPVILNLLPEQGSIELQHDAAGKVHRFHTLTGHCYLSRGIYLNRAQFERWPSNLQDAIQRAARAAIEEQRRLAVAEEAIARQERAGNVVA